MVKVTIHHLFAIINIAFVENGVRATFPYSSCLTETSSIPTIGSDTGLTGEPDLESLPCSTVQPCKGCEQSFAIKELIIRIDNSRLFKIQQTSDGRLLAPCENNTKILAQELSGCSCLEGIGKCDLSYVVFILSIVDGKMQIVGQGVQLTDCTILTSFSITLLGDEGLWVKYSNNVLKRVICMKDPKQSRYVLSEALYSVKLVVESDGTDYNTNCGSDNCACTCCNNNPCFGPEILTYSASPAPVPGYLITRRNCSSTDYSLLATLGVLVNDPTDAAISILVIDQPERLCHKFEGAVFISSDCKVLGFNVIKTRVGGSTLNSVILLQEIQTSCILFIAPFEL